jgi:hypothetical protein
MAALSEPIHESFGGKANYCGTYLSLNLRAILDTMLEEFSIPLCGLLLVMMARSQETDDTEIPYNVPGCIL